MEMSDEKVVLDAAKMERLQRVIKDSRCSQRKIAIKSGLNSSNLSKMAKGKQTITKQTIDKICKALNVSLDWFENGVGEMYCCNKNEDKEEEQKNEFGHLDIKSLATEVEYLKKLVSDKDKEILFLRSLLNGQIKE